MELRYDPRERESHIADGTGFLCHRLRPGYEKRRPKTSVALRMYPGEIKDVECPHCDRMYRQTLSSGAS